MDQNIACEFFMPLINFLGKVYKKTSPVYAYIAKDGEYIETWTADGLETTNYAKKGDYVVSNINSEAKEKYIVTEEVFHQRYEKIHNCGEGFIMKPLGKVKGTIYHGSEMEFVAAWGRLMVIKPGDMIVTPLPDCNEVYRIARKEFNETYTLDEDLL